MNRSFSSPLGMSPFSPRTRLSLTSKKVLPQSFKKSSRYSVSGKSTQSVQIILSTPYNYVERFGQPLPVLITEALIVDRNTIVSARISKTGYAWVVCGRRLFIWQYRQSPIQFDTPQKKSSLNQCYELQLPQSDLAHRAELVSVFVNPESPNSPSCIAVSPAGVVRFWPAIIHEEISVEENVKLNGQECDSLVDVEGLGCILATTSSTVLLIQPQQTSGRHSLTTQTLKIPSGWLGGISKRMSSLIFGPISSEHSSETGIVRVLATPRKRDYWHVYVLADRSLQKWRLSQTAPQQLFFVADLQTMVRDSFRAVLWDNCGAESEIDLFFLDIQADKDNVIVLAAAVNLPISPRVHYAMVYLQTNSDQPPTSVKDFLMLKITDLFREDNAEAMCYRFLLGGSYAYLYNSRQITVIKPHEEPDTLEFDSPQDFLLAGAICVNTPVFFSRIHGLVSVAANEVNSDFNMSATCSNTPVETSFNDSNVIVNNLSIYNLDPDEVTQTKLYEHLVAPLKSAFVLHVQRQEMASKQILATHFDGVKLPGIDSTLDKSVLCLLNELIDDIPANDSRWNKDIPIGCGSSNSMQVINQLEDKQKAIAIYLGFLKESGLWDQLAAVTIRNSTMATILIILEANEKIVAARILKSMSLTKPLEIAIERCVANMGKTPENGLTNQDLFYREISKIHCGLQELVNYCEDICHSNMNPGQIVDILNESNDIMLNVLKEVLKYRKQNIEHFKVSEQISAIAPDFLPWTAAPGAEGLVQSLSQIHYLTYNYGVMLTKNDNLRHTLFDQLLDLTDIILDGRKSHLESIKGLEKEDILYKQYCSDRQKYMRPFVKEMELERAAILAEKYLDFDTLILVCDATENQQRLDEYLARFSQDGFSEHVYNWYLKENKQGKLIDNCRRFGKSQNLNRLTNFLADHPSLAWIQNIFDKNYNGAAEVLKSLASQETESLKRQKTMLSLGKLAKLANNNHHRNADDYLFDVEKRLELIAFQEDIPDYVLQQYGYDTVNIPVIQPKDLIELYIAEEYKESGELEFKKALDLLKFVDDEEIRQDLWYKIWRRAIMKDSWNDSNLDSPLEILQNKLFFRLVELTMHLDGDVLNFLPPIDGLLDDECLNEWQNNPNFQYLLKTGYEHVYKTHTSE